MNPPTIFIIPGQSPTKVVTLTLAFTFDAREWPDGYTVERFATDSFHLATAAIEVEAPVETSLTWVTEDILIEDADEEGRR